MKNPRLKVKLMRIWNLNLLNVINTAFHSIDLFIVKTLTPQLRF